MYYLCFASCLYYAWIHSSLSRDCPQVKEQLQSARSASPMTTAKPPSPRLCENRENKYVNKGTFGYVWMSVPKNYRCVIPWEPPIYFCLLEFRASSDDGIFTGLLLGPLISLVLLINTSRLLTPHSYKATLPPGWIIEAPKELHNLQGSYAASQALFLARYSLVNLSTLCSSTLLLHIYASWWFEWRYSKLPGAGDGERTSVPRNEGRRMWYYTLFATVVSLAVTMTRFVLQECRIGIWQRKDPFVA